MQIQTKGDQNKNKNPPFQEYWYSAWPRAGPCQTRNGERFHQHVHTRVQMVPSLLSWQSRRTPGNPQAAFHTKAQNVPAFLFPKMPPVSCVPYTNFVCVLCRSPVLSRRKPSTIHTCASLPALDLDQTDVSFYLVGSLSPTTRATNLPSFAVL